MKKRKQSDGISKNDNSKRAKTKNNIMVKQELENNYNNNILIVNPPIIKQQYSKIYSS